MIDLVLKWNPSRCPDTIDRHLEIVSTRGSVWWGRRSFSYVGLREEWLTKFRSQLAADRRTYVYLHSKLGGTWRAVLLNVTTDASAIDIELVPTYYDPVSHYTLWVNLTGFQKSDPSQLTEQYVLARTGAPLTTKGLNNQTPLILRRRNSASLTSETKPIKIPKLTAGHSDARD